MTRKLTPALSARTFSLGCFVALLCTAASAQARSPLDGSLKIRNDRATPIGIAIDGRDHGRLAPGQKRVFRDVPNGVRLVAISCRIAGHESQQITIPVRGVGKLKVRALQGTAEVRNPNRVAMRVELNGKRIGTVSPRGRLSTAALRPGHYSLEARPVGRHRGPALKTSFRVQAGKETPVRLGEWFASLQVRNRSDRGARLYIDGKRVERLHGGESARLKDLAPGRHRVELRRRHGRVVASAELRLRPGQAAEWSPAPRFANAAYQPAGEASCNQHPNRAHRARAARTEVAVYRPRH